jgi:hypothetical protein
MRCGKEFESVWVGKEAIRSAETCGMQTAQTSCGKEFERETGNFTDFFQLRKGGDYFTCCTPPDNDWAACASRHRASKNSVTIGAVKRRSLLQSLPAAALLPASAWASLQ